MEELRLAAANDAVAENVQGIGGPVGADTVGADGAGDPAGFKNGARIALDPRTMGIATTACGGYLSTEAAGGRACNLLVIRHASGMIIE